jgi:hypothetical protein
VSARVDLSWWLSPRGPRNPWEREFAGWWSLTGFSGLCESVGLGHCQEVARRRLFQLLSMRLRVEPYLAVLGAWWEARARAQDELGEEEESDWVERADDLWRVLSVEERAMAEAMARARAAAHAAASEQTHGAVRAGEAHELS